MEDVLEVYKRPLDPKRPLVCMDELSKQLIGEVRTPIPMTSGKPAKFDYEYKRLGVANMFMFFAPLVGKRTVAVTEQRTRNDWALAMRDLLEETYPEAEKIVLVMDNLNTHSPASFYEAFPPDEAKRLTDRLEIHYTPEHGSWLNMAEIELSVLHRQCLDRRIDSMDFLKREVASWELDRNHRKTKTNWQFTTEDARVKLKNLYPSD